MNRIERVLKERGFTNQNPDSPAYAPQHWVNPNVPYFRIVFLWMTDTVWVFTAGGQEFKGRTNDEVITDPVAFNRLIDDAIVANFKAATRLGLK